MNWDMWCFIGFLVTVAVCIAIDIERDNRRGGQ